MNPTAIYTFAELAAATLNFVQSGYAVKNAENQLFPMVTKSFAIIALTTVVHSTRLSLYLHMKI